MMLKLRTYTFIAYFIHFTTARHYDIELSGTLQKELLNKILDDRESTSVELHVNIPKQLGKFLRVLNSPLGARRKDNTKFSDAIPDLVLYLSSKGIDRLKKACDILQRELKFTTELSTSILEAGQNEFVSKFQLFTDSFPKRKAYYRIDKEMMMLDIVEFSNGLVYEEAAKLLQAIIAISPTYTDPKIIQTITEELYINTYMDKKHDLKYLCDSMKLCRIFPAFSDYFADLLGNIAKNSTDRKFHHIVMKTAKLLKNEYDTIVNILGIPLTSIVGRQLQNIIGDLSDVKEFVSTMCRYLWERRKWTNSQDNGKIKKTKAIKILLDIIDKAFKSDGEQAVGTHFGATFAALRAWVNELRTDGDTIVLTFIRYVTNTLSKNWSTETKVEARVLVEIITLGETKNKPVYKYLFSKGSRYISENLL